MKTKTVKIKYEVDGSQLAKMKKQIEEIGKLLEDISKGIEIPITVTTIPNKKGKWWRFWK